MAITLNTISLTGRLVSTGELINANNGSLIYNNALAVEDKINGIKDAFFIDIKAFNKQAQHIINTAGKGSKITITGRLCASRWQDRNTNQMRQKIYVAVNFYECISKFINQNAGQINNNQFNNNMGVNEAPNNQNFGVNNNYNNGMGNYTNGNMNNQGYGVNNNYNNNMGNYPNVNNQNYTYNNNIQNNPNGNTNSQNYSMNNNNNFNQFNGADFQ